MDSVLKKKFKMGFMNKVNKNVEYAYEQACENYTIYGRSVQVETPDTYQRLDYIQSSGSQHVLTDITVDNETGFMLDFEPTSLSGDMVFAGCRNITTGRFWIGQNNGGLYFGWNAHATATASRPQLQIGSRYQAYLNFFNSRTAYCDQFTLKDNLTTEMIAHSRPIAVFAGNNIGTIAYKASYKLYNLKVTKGSEIKYDFYPAKRLSDNKVGLYDVINKKFTVGTDTFTLGENAIMPKYSSPIRSLGDTHLSNTAKAFYIYKNDENKLITFGGIEPLRSIGDVSDYIDYKSGEIIRNIGKFTFNAKDVFSIYEYNGTLGILANNVLDETLNRAVGICTNSDKVGEFYSSNSIWVGANNNSVYWVGILDELGITNTDDFKTWLSSNPVTVYYVRNTPTNYGFQLSDLQISDGASRITAKDSYVETDKVEVEYRGRMNND